MTEPIAKSDENLNNFVSIRKAAERVGYTSDYVSRLARQGKIQARRDGKQWLVDVDSLKLFFLAAEAQKRAFKDRVRKERRLEQIKFKRLAIARPGGDVQTQSASAFLEALAVTACVVLLFFLGMHWRSAELKGQNLAGGVQQVGAEISGVVQLSDINFKDLPQKFPTLSANVQNLPSSLSTSGQVASLAASSGSLFSDIWCGFKLLWNKNDACLEIPPTEYALVIPKKEPSVTNQKADKASGENAGASPVTYVVNEYVTNPVTVIREEVDKVARQQVVTVKEFIEVQTDATHDSINLLSQGLGESFNTQTLTVSGAATFSGSLNGAAATLTSLQVNGPATTTSLALRGSFFDSNSSAGTSGYILQSTGTSTLWVATSTLGLSGGNSITSLNGLTGATQTFATGTATGIGLNIVSSGTTHTFTPTVSTGYTIPLTASTTNWNTAYDDWFASNANWDAAYASTTALTNSYIRGLFSNTATGLTYNSSTGATSLTSGYTIPLTASTTNWNDFFNTPSGRITAGDALTWSGNTLNFDGGNSPGGELGGTWASPTIDDSLAVSSWTLTTSSIADSLTVTDDDWIGLGSAAGRIVFDDLATDRVSIMDANVGIGTDSPGKTLHLVGSEGGLSFPGMLRIDDNTALAADNGGAITFGYVFNSSGGITHGPGIRGVKENATDGNTGAGVSIFTRPTSGGAATERIRVLADGNVGIGTNSPQRKLHVAGTARITTSVSVADDRTLCTIATDGDIELKNGACGTSSLRYKENIEELGYGLADVRKLNPVFFNYIKDADQSGDMDVKDGRTKRRIGFIAEEMWEVIPEVVIWEGGQIDGIDYAYLTSLSIKSIQELDLKLEELATTTLFADLEKTSFTKRFFNKLIAWFADKKNGIGDFFANRVRTKEICVGDNSGKETCVTKADIDRLLSGSAGSATIINFDTASGGAETGGSGGGGTNDTTATSTDSGAESNETATSTDPWGSLGQTETDTATSTDDGTSDSAGGADTSSDEQTATPPTEEIVEEGTEETVAEDEPEAEA